MPIILFSTGAHPSVATEYSQYPYAGNQVFAVFTMLLRLLLRGIG